MLGEQAKLGEEKLFWVRCALEFFGAVWGGWTVALDSKIGYAGAD
jgi:hypothetical protein